MCILDACVGTEAACRRKPMRGIISQENPAVPEAFSDLRCSGPESNVNHFDGKGRDADGASCKRQAPFGCEVFWFLPFASWKDRRINQRSVPCAHNSVPLPRADI